MVATYATPVAVRDVVLPSTPRTRPAPSPRPASRPASPARRAEASSGAAGLGGLRLTARGRVVVSLLAALVVAPLLLVGTQAVASAPGEPLEVRVHTVAPGETLWGFAAALATAGQDVRDVVDRLQDINGLASGELQVGQTILLPVEG